MKKVIFCAIALMLGGMTYAQYGPQYVGPTETSALQPALPGAAVGANTGLSIQNGLDHKVRVQQAGTEQSAYSFQDNGSGSGGNLADIGQMGHMSDDSGVQNAADVIQSGDINQSTTMQRGDYNSAVTKQGLNYASIGNKGFIEQGMMNHEHATNNTAKLEQDGADNQGVIYQTYDYNDAWTVQDGERNNSFVRQIADPHMTAGHYAYTKQIGADNENTIMQNGMGTEGLANWAWAYQTGSENKSHQSQINTGLAGSEFVNYAMVDQGAFQEGLLTVGNITALTILDSKVVEKLAGLSTFTSGSLAFQNQNGDDLDAEVHQFGKDSYSEQNQTGSGNDAFVIQDSNGESGHYARQDQDGTNSFATLGQFGNGNRAWQRQLDDDNIVVSSQIGHNNKLNTYQDGDGNRGNTIQHGKDNLALLTQRGGHSYSIVQHGQGNQADILQLDGLGDFTADYINCSFENPIDAPIMNDIPELIIDPICNGG
jgi:hypothetical protein